MEKKDDTGIAVAQKAPIVAVRNAAECGVPGVHLSLDFVSLEEEAALLQLADSQQHWQALAKRRVLHWGRAFDYESRGVGPQQHPIPAEARVVAARVEALPGAVPVDQLTVNEYAPGVGISPHVETHSAFTGAIASLSLAGPAVMVLRREGEQPRALFLPPRSLLLLSGEARYCWQHYIPHRKSDLVVAPAGGGPTPEVVPRAQRRVSFTFRQVRHGPCDCPYPHFCDSQLAPLEPTRMALKRMAWEQQRNEEQRRQQQHLHQAAAEQQGHLQQQQQQGQQQQAATEQQQIQHEPSAQARGVAAKGSSLAKPHATPGAGPSPGSDSNGLQQPAKCPLDDASVDRQLAALEAQYVHSVYNAIAPHFSATRFAIWPRVRAFLQSLPPGALLADVGCGNGKYFGVRRDAFVLASDRSEGLAKVAARRLQPGPANERLLADVAVADGMALPYRPASCDGALCIAVLHHIASPARRLALLAQLLRILQPGGRALVTVWATEQENMRKVRSWQPISTPSSASADSDAAGAAATGTQCATGATVSEHSIGAAHQAQKLAADQAAVTSGDFFVPWHLPFHRAEAAAAAKKASNRSGQQQALSRKEAVAAAGTCLSAEIAAGAAQSTNLAAASPRVDSGKGAIVYQRYYHLFERGELDGLVSRLPGAAVVESYYDKDNWCCVFERRKES